MTNVKAIKEITHGMTNSMQVVLGYVELQRYKEARERITMAIEDLLALDVFIVKLMEKDKAKKKPPKSVTKE